MNKKNKQKSRNLTTSGFTLIELLAVITIMGILMIIAIPAVTKTISNSRKNVFKDTANKIVEAGKVYYADQQIESGGLSEDVTFDFANYNDELAIEGKLPTSGTITITTEGKISLAASDGRFCATKGFDDKEVKVKNDDGNCTLSSSEDNSVKTLKQLSRNGTENQTCVEKGQICSTTGEGTLFTIQVNETDTYNFYVLSDDGNKVSLIMDRNLGENIPWINEADYIAAGGNKWVNTENEDGILKNVYGNNEKGPITALTALQERTSTWTNVTQLEISTFEYDDGREEVPLGNNKVFKTYARLPKYAEITTVFAAGRPNYLMQNIPEPAVGYYWFSADDYHPGYALVVAMFSYGQTHASSEVAGVRPVIELLK